LLQPLNGPGSDEPLVWYEGTGTSDRRFLVADERGSIVAVTDSAGAALAINRYDEYGIPQSTNAGRFQYTGQAWIAELGMYHYKARIYSPTLGRFMQTDPIGYGDGMNWYNYVHGDPVNGTDPSGMLEPLSKSDWKCYGNCGGGYANSSLWPTGTATLGGTGQDAGGSADPGLSPKAVPSHKSSTHGLSNSNLSDSSGGEVILVMGSHGHPIPNRTLTSDEIDYFSKFYDRESLSNIRLMGELPIGFGGDVLAVTTSKTNIWLRPNLFGPNMLANSYLASLLGHELYHATIQYASGWSYGMFIKSYIECLCYRESDAEIKAFQMESTIRGDYNNTFGRGVLQ